MNNKDKIIGILLVVIVASIFLTATENEVTGEVIKDSGWISVRPEVYSDPVDIYIDGMFIQTIPSSERLNHYKIKSGEHNLLAKSVGKEDWVETVNVVVGKTIVVRPWHNPEYI